MSEATPAKRVEREPWEKQPAESFKAFAAFALYRDLTSTRTLVQAAKILHETQTRRKEESILRQLQDWSAKHKWRDRCDAYDAMTDRRYREAREAAKERAARIESGIASGIIRLGASRLLGDENAGVQPIDANSLDARDAAALVDMGIKWRRVSDGQHTDAVKGAIQLSFAQAEDLVRQVFEQTSAGWAPFTPTEFHDQALQAAIANVEQIGLGRAA